MQMTFGPQTPFAEYIHLIKYRGKGESFEEAMNRIAAVLAPGESYKKFRDILLHQRFLPGGRIQAAVGSTEKGVTPYNCLAGETLILTREYGVTQIQTVANRDVTVLDGQGQWVMSRINVFGYRPVHTVRLTLGKVVREIRATPDHRWILADGTERTTATLKKNDRISNLLPPRQASHEGLVHGVVYGDGSNTESLTRWQLRLCGVKSELLSILQASARTVTYPPSCNGDPFMTFDSAVNLKELPSFDKGTDYLFSFIQGWFATDGCVSEKGELTLCAGPDEIRWLRSIGPSVGLIVMGDSCLAHITNFGVRKKDSRNVRLHASSFRVNEFIRSQHKERARNDVYEWRVSNIRDHGEQAETFCPRVFTTDSFVLEAGIHTGQCFVSGSIADSFVAGGGSIMARATEAAQTMRMGGGIGYDFSTLRPRGALIKKLGSQSSGPVSFMEIFDAVCRCVASSGHRRGAQMGVMRVDHPDIEEFIRAKQNAQSLTGFNISVAITDEFMNAVEAGLQFPLRFGGQIYNEVDARSLFDMIMRSTWDWAEPGVLFIDRINDANNLHYCEEIAATNPCGEQPLPPFGACLLGSFNLVKYLRVHPGFDDTSILRFDAMFDMSQFVADIYHVVPAMDRVIDIAKYPIDEQEKEAHAKRRMGLGITGLANTLEAMGFPYGSVEFLNGMETILHTLMTHAYLASTTVAAEKGSFPAFRERSYMAGEFIEQLPDDVRKEIRISGIRNSHLLSIAPTGTISLSADNVSSGIEPVFAYETDRTLVEFDGVHVHRVQDYGVKFLNTYGKRAEDVTIDEHLSVLLTAQRYVDSAVSKTLNVPEDCSWESFKSIYINAWRGRAKGCTTYRVGGKRDAVLIGKDDEGACRIDPQTGTKTCE